MLEYETVIVFNFRDLWQFVTYENTEMTTGVMHCYFMRLYYMKKVACIDEESVSLLLATCIDTSEPKCVTFTTTTSILLYVYGWKTFDVMAQKDTSSTVHTVLGNFTTADIMKMWPCPVIVMFYLHS